MTEKKETLYQEKKKSIPKNINQKPLAKANVKTDEGKELKVKEEKTNAITENKENITLPQEESKNISDKKEDSKSKAIKKEEKLKVKKYEAISRGHSLPISKKHGMYLCSFVKNKKIDQAIRDLNLVISLKKAVPFKGEIPHRKGLKGSGRYPVKASICFINLLKGLKGNAIVNGLELENLTIYFASASWASRHLRSEGRLAKRTNVVLKAREFLNKGAAK